MTTDIDMDVSSAVTFDPHPVIMRGGWHMLCVGVMSQAVHRLASESNLFNSKHIKAGERGGGYCKEGVHQRTQAKEWLGGGVGMITFEDCCDELGVDPARARKKILAWCQSKKRAKLPPPEFFGGGDGQEEG